MTSISIMWTRDILFLSTNLNVRYLQGCIPVWLNIKTGQWRERKCESRVLRHRVRRSQTNNRCLRLLHSTNVLLRVVAPRHWSLCEDPRLSGGSKRRTCFSSLDNAKIIIEIGVETLIARLQSVPMSHANVSKASYSRRELMAHKYGVHLVVLAV